MFGITQKIYLDTSNLYVPESTLEFAQEFYDSVFDKVMDAFSGSNVEIVLEPPTEGPFSTLDLNNIINNSGKYLGIAEFDQTFNPSDNGQVRIDNIMDVAFQDQLPIDQASNLVSNIVCHEAGHLMGLDDTNNPDDIMCGGQITNSDILDPPHFSPDQIQAINTNAVLANIDNPIAADQSDLSNSFDDFPDSNLTLEPGLLVIDDSLSNGSGFDDVDGLDGDVDSFDGDIDGLDADLF